jgi:hypothetical protein
MLTMERGLQEHSPDGDCMAVVGGDNDEGLPDVDHGEGCLHRGLQAEGLLHGVPGLVLVVTHVNPPALHQQHESRLRHAPG